MLHERIGKKAKIVYEGGPKGEEPIDSTEGEVREVTLGLGFLPKGIDEAFQEMAVGEERVVTVPPEKGFGNYDPDGVKEYPRFYIENGEKLTVGDVVTWRNPASGAAVPARVVNANETAVQLDLNHPFAGKVLEYRLKLVGIAE